MAQQLRRSAASYVPLPDLAPRQLLNTALKRVYLAFQKFSVVATIDALRTAVKIELILMYLRVVYKLTRPLQFGLSRPYSKR